MRPSLPNLPRTSGPGHHPERRRIDRYICPPEVRCWLRTEGDARGFPAGVSTISPAGATLIAASSPGSGRIVLAEFFSAYGKRIPAVTARVVYDLPLPQGDMALGCAFVKPLSAREFQNLLDEWVELQNSTTPCQ